MSDIIEKLKSFLSKKWLGTVLSTAVVVFGLDIPPELQAKLVAGAWAIYVMVQGFIDYKGK